MHARNGRDRRAATALAAAAMLFALPVSAQTPAARAASGDLARIARAVTPAVVSIESEFAPQATARLRGREQGLPPGFPPGFAPPDAMPNVPGRAGGTGFIVSADGYILTNNHVVSGATRVNVTLLDRRIFTARVIGHDPATDIALIKIDGTGLPTVTLGDDSTAQVGDAVLAVGNPLGLDFTVTAGIVSAKGRSGGLRALFASDYAIVDFIQTDAVINPGNSGGPLIDMQGRVIGINSAIESPTGVYAGYGFAIPVSIGRIVMDQFRRYGHTRRALLGVSLQDVGPADAKAAGLAQITGVLVGGFAPGTSPARRAGVQLGDIVLSVDGRPIDRVSELQRLILGHEPGQTVTLSLQHFGAQRTARVTLGEAPATPDTSAVASAAPTARGRLGIDVEPLTATAAAQLGVPSQTAGLIVGGVDPSGPAADYLTPHDVIVGYFDAAGTQHVVRTTQDLQSAIASSGHGIVSLIVARGQGTWVENIPLTP